MNIKNLLFGPQAKPAPFTHFGLLLLRVFAGLAMAFGHGIGKVPPSEGFIGGIAKLGFPLAGLFAWSAGLAEFLGGILIALGLMTRPSALFLSITMLVAAFLKHGDDPFSSQEKALLYAFISILFVLAGPGKYSADQIIVNRMKK